eukprot:scaffold1261_cov74-Isochrysis_galbana.AAC.1
MPPQLRKGETSAAVRGLAWHEKRPRVPSTKPNTWGNTGRGGAEAHWPAAWGYRRRGGGRALARRQGGYRKGGETRTCPPPRCARRSTSPAATLCAPGHCRPQKTSPTLSGLPPAPVKAMGRASGVEAGTISIRCCPYVSIVCHGARACAVDDAEGFLGGQNGGHLGRGGGAVGGEGSEGGLGWQRQACHFVLLELQ